VGPFTIVPHQLSHSAGDSSSAVDQQLDRLLRAREAALTHAGPRELLPRLRATLKGLHLPLQLYEAYLGAAFPLPALQVAVLPAELLPQQMHVGMGCILVGTAGLCLPPCLARDAAGRAALASEAYPARPSWPSRCSPLPPAALPRS
jgi:hypothetical protein